MIKNLFIILKKNDYSDFTFMVHGKKLFILKGQNDFPIKIIRYEDLLSNTYYTFEELIKFINCILKIETRIDERKLKNSIDSTSFEKLKNYEKNYGFSEAINSKNNNQNIPFFYLGPENDWKKLLDQNFKEKLNNTFNKSLKYFSYI